MVTNGTAISILAKGVTDFKIANIAFLKLDSFKVINDGQTFNSLKLESLTKKKLAEIFPKYC